MATHSILVPGAPVREVVGPSGFVSWPLWTLVLAVILVTVGGQTDVAWHRSIGRDGFWILPHVLVYSCGLLAAASCGYLILVNTFGHAAQDAVSLFGLRAPLGALLTAWGGLAMLASAPFDNWWHNAYGLDVQVQSPPHIVLLIGTWAVCQGTLLLAAAAMNRARLAGQETSNATTRIFLFVGALAVFHLMSYSMSYTFDTRLHQAKPYLVMSTGVPFALAALASTVRRRWTATTIAAIYTAFMLSLVWLLPLVPAAPQLGPVYETVTHLIPPKFPILLLVPALGLDLLWQRSERLGTTLTTVLSGPLWVALLVAAEWPFASFLMSAHALGPVFATGPGFLDFGTSPTDADALRIFDAPQHGARLWLTLALATVLASIMIRGGQSFGRWMRKIVR